MGASRLKTKRIASLPRVALLVGLAALGVVLLLLRMTVITDYLYAATVKDPDRTPPPGNVIVAPADGTVLYVRRVTGGVVPEVVKRGVRVPLGDHLKYRPDRPPADGWLIGIYMNSDGVHVNRVPIGGRVLRRVVYNGPHMDMSPTERTVILTQLVPGLVALRKLLGLAPYAIENRADYVLKSARETLLIEDLRGARVWVVRIADYWVGKILTWVAEGDTVETGQRLGMITWGSQTDVFVEDSPGLTVRAQVGKFVHGGETVLATY